MEAELGAVRSDLDKEKDLSTKLKAQIDELKEELLTFQKRLGGMKSGKIRSANVIQPGDQCCLCSAVSQSDSCNLIQVTSTTDHPKIFIGLKYTKSSSEKIVLYSVKTDAGVMLLRRTAKDSSVSSVPYLKVKDLAKYVNDVFTNLELQNKVSYTGFNDEIWILFSGDKGGSLMKFHFEIINGTSTGSIFNVHVFCLYE